MSDTSSSAGALRTSLDNDELGPYVLRKLDLDIALSEDGSRNDIHITCVDFWEGNLYIGTSASEILHYFLIPPADDDDQNQQFILATRLQPQFSEAINQSLRIGIQQILVLRSVNKACILCNGTLTFYTLPELSPIFTNTKLNNCLWVGGLDEGGEEAGDDNQDGTVIMICQKSRTRLIRIGDKLQRVREVEVGGYIDTIRRGNIACVADSKSYHLLDVVERQRIPLFDVSTSGNDSPGGSSATPNTARSPEEPIATPELLNPKTRQALELPTHSRSVSSSNITVEDPQRTLSPQPRIRAASLQAQDPPPRRSSLQPPPAEGSRSHSRSPSQASQDTFIRPSNVLLPHIASPSPGEFLLTTGTSLEDPGVGLFVNLDGDVVRGTLEFSKYPDFLCIDGPDATGGDDMPERDQFVLAIITATSDDRLSKKLEIQNVDQESGTVNSGKFWLHMDDYELITEPYALTAKNGFGVRPAVSQISAPNARIADILVLNRFVLPGSKQPEGDADGKRNRIEAQFIQRLSKTDCKILVWAMDKVWWATRNPAIVRLHDRLHRAVKNSPEGAKILDSTCVQEVLGDILGEEPTTELEFLTLRSVRQQASMMLYLDLLAQSTTGTRLTDRARELTEQALTDGEVDPRLVLAVTPIMKQEVVQGLDGIWIPRSLKILLDNFASQYDQKQDQDVTSPGGFRDLLQLLRRYLSGWRRKKGFGSITDEKEVFQTVDAGLIHVLLLLDQGRPKGPGKKGSIRSEINAVVDHGVDCFNRVVELLEQFKRLYILSRLYQSRKMSSKVLSIWRRILDGEEDAGGELVDGEQEMRRYLTVVSDPAIVEKYGTWLASRNSRLGVRVFADSNSKVKFTPQQAISILKERAPNAVKDYLEYLVFDKDLASHATDLITYYLDSVLHELSTSDTSRSHLLLSYTTYRSLHPPKPTYSHFAADNALTEDWWRNRLRLLQLLGGSHGAASQYNIAGILARIEPFSAELVPETIVLSGRQGKHREAIHLLVHGLGDYDTAVRYCLLGGEGTYSPTSIANGPLAAPTAPSADARARQTELFANLLSELLSLPDVSDQITQTSELLERFAPFFEPEHVLSLVPDSWSVDKLEVFLRCAVRKLVVERNETSVEKALVSVVNLATAVEMGEKMGKGGVVQTEEEHGKGIS